MADSTLETRDAGTSRGGRRPRAHAGRVLALVLVIAAVTPVTPAFADGDPASDVLAAQALFLPQDAGASGTQAQRLAAEIGAAARTRPLRVAIVASPSDLGAVTALWRRPQDYARFLGQEIALVYGGEVLVVMPNGDGLAVGGRAAAPADAALVAHLPAPGRAIVTGALAAVTRLNDAHGVTVTVTARSRGATGGATTLTWLVFAAGLAVIAGAWTLSLRARPLSAARR